MPADTAKLRRLQRLERIRAVAKQSALTQAAEAETTVSQLQLLATRTDMLAAGYTGGPRLTDGHDLRTRGLFVCGLSRISVATHHDAERARQEANHRQQCLAESEQRRAAVEERATACKRDLARGRQITVVGARRPIGTDLE